MKQIYIYIYIDDTIPNGVCFRTDYVLQLFELWLAEFALNSKLGHLKVWEECTCPVDWCPP